MKKDNVFYKSSYKFTKGYKYVAVILEFANAHYTLYASNNLRDLKSCVYHEVRQLYSDASGNIYYSSDENFKDPLYMCWNKGCKTYRQNQYRRK